MNEGMIKEFCELESDSLKLLSLAHERFQYSARSYNKFLKIARTFADLEGSERIRKVDISAALLARDLDCGSSAPSELLIAMRGAQQTGYAKRNSSWPVQFIGILWYNHVCTTESSGWVAKSPKGGEAYELRMSNVCDCFCDASRIDNSRNAKEQVALPFATELFALD